MATEIESGFLGRILYGVTAPFYLAKPFQLYFSEGAAIVNISSSRDRMSQPQTESYTAAKGGISALTHALAVSLAGRVRVNSISPGWIDTDFIEYTGADAVQQPVHRVGNPMDIANMVLFLCSEKAGFITGENICIDGGMTKQMIYHGDYGWRFDMKIYNLSSPFKAQPWKQLYPIDVIPSGRVSVPFRLSDRKSVV